MPKSDPTPVSERDDLEELARRCPTTWFSRLENALAVGDFEAALEADRELKRLGVRVRFPSIREHPLGESSRPVPVAGESARDE